jgi:TolB-like protein/Tfp pilus assembly protein PilF
MGLADALITRLSNVRQVLVRPTSAVLRYRSVDADPVAAGRELRVDSVLEGSIRRTAQRTRVTVQLVSARDGAPLWAEKFDEDLTDMFAVEDSISERAARALTRKLSREEHERLVRHQTSSPEAHKLYLKGRYHAAKFTPVGLRKALDCFQQAVKLDSGYALAHLGLAYYYFAACNEFSLPPSQAMPRTKKAALRALELDDSLGEAHMFLAGVRFWYEWDWPAAQTGFERAVRLAPYSAVAHFYRGLALAWMDRIDDGLASCRRAAEIDPLSAEAITNVGICCYFGRRCDEALDQLRQAVEIDPDYWFAWLQIGRVHELAGRSTESIEALRRAWRLQTSYPEVLTDLARAYAVAGRKAKARSLLEDVMRRSRRSYVPAYHVARALAGLGDRDEALTWLEKAVAQRSSFATWLRTDPALDALRTHARFAALIRTVGLWH